MHPYFLYFSDVKLEQAFQRQRWSRLANDRAFLSFGIVMCAFNFSPSQTVISGLPIQTSCLIFALINVLGWFCHFRWKKDPLEAYLGVSRTYAAALAICSVYHITTYQASRLPLYPSHLSCDLPTAALGFHVMLGIGAIIPYFMCASASPKVAMLVLPAFSGYFYPYWLPQICEFGYGVGETVLATAIGYFIEHSFRAIFLCEAIAAHRLQQLERDLFALTCHEVRATLLYPHTLHPPPFTPTLAATLALALITGAQSAQRRRRQLSVRDGGAAAAAPQGGLSARA